MSLYSSDGEMGPSAAYILRDVVMLRYTDTKVLWRMYEMQELLSHRNL
jgi:hypothetical protein